MALHDTLWSLAIIGRGSSAAYHLSTVDRIQYPSVAVIGLRDPWDGQRGHAGSPGDPTLSINHPAHLIEHLSDKVPGFGTTMYDREAWAAANRRVIEEYTRNSTAFTGLVDDGEVVKIEKVPLPGVFVGVPGAEVFRLDLRGSRPPAYAKKVVVATGAGAHSVPKEVEAAKGRLPGQVLDIDQFAHLGPAQLRKETTVFVMGPNAAIDAVQKALHYGCRIVWLVRGKSEPAVLASQDTVKAAVARDKEFKSQTWSQVATSPAPSPGDPQLIYRYEAGGLAVSADGRKLKVVVDTPNRLNAREKKTLWGDYFAYGIGQDSKAATGILAPFMDSMEPIYDINGRFGKPGDAIIAFRAEANGWATGLEVVGALCGQVATSLMSGVRDAPQLGERIDKLRSEIMKVIEQKAEWRATWATNLPYLFLDLGRLKSLPRATLFGGLDDEVRAFSQTTDRTWSDQLRSLASLLKNYYLAIHHPPENLASKLRKPAQTLTATVADSGQLGAIRAQTTAVNNFVPNYVGSQKENADFTVTTKPGSANFNTDDQQALALFVALKYPFVSPQSANDIVEGIVTGRRDAEARPLAGRGDAKGRPLGFSPAEQNRILRMLEILNRAGMNSMASPKVVGTGRTSTPP